MAQRIICMIDLKSNICFIFCKSKHYIILARIFRAKDSIGSGIKTGKESDLGKSHWWKPEDLRMVENT